MKKKTEIKGIFVKSNKTFYYIESGPITVGNTIDRIINSLIAKDIIQFTATRDEVNEEKYKMLSLADAESKGYKIETMYLSAHVKRTAPEAEAAQTVKWGKPK